METDLYPHIDRARLGGDILALGPLKRDLLARLASGSAEAKEAGNAIEAALAAGDANVDRLTGEVTIAHTEDLLGEMLEQGYPDGEG